VLAGGRRAGQHPRMRRHKQRAAAVRSGRCPYRWRNIARSVVAMSFSVPRVAQRSPGVRDGRHGHGGIFFRLDVFDAAERFPSDGITARSWPAKRATSTPNASGYRVLASRGMTTQSWWVEHRFISTESVCFFVRLMPWTGFGCSFRRREERKAPRLRSSHLHRRRGTSQPVMWSDALVVDDPGVGRAVVLQRRDVTLLHVSPLTLRRRM